MRKIREQGGAIRKAVIISILLVCSIVGGIGIFTAPKSDQDEMKQELERNEQLLQEMETKEQKTPDPAGGNGSGSGTEKEDGQGDMPQEDTAEEKNISVIGDSVFLGAAPAFKKIQKNAVIDAKVSRQVSQALDVAKKLKKKGKLGEIVIISLGINGNFNEATGQALIDYLGKERTIYWVNAHGKDVSWQREVNRTIEKLAEKNDTVRVIDWDRTAEKHPDWFYQDGTHLNAKGQEGFARFIKREI